MQSKHDLFTALITVVLLIITGILTYTGHMTGAVGTALAGGVAMIFTYWFTRGGAITATQAATSATDTPAQTMSKEAVQTIVNATLDGLAQQPAKVVSGNETASKS